MALPSVHHGFRPFGRRVGAGALRHAETKGDQGQSSAAPEGTQPVAPARTRLGFWSDTVRSHIARRYGVTGVKRNGVGALYAV